MRLLLVAVLAAFCVLFKPWPSLAARAPLSFDEGSLQVTSHLDFRSHIRTPDTLKTFSVDTDFVSSHAVDFWVFVREKAQICFKGDAVVAQKVVSMILSAAATSGKAFAERIDLGVDSIHQTFRYETLGSFRTADVSIPRCR